jgi:hypothetical protein
MNNNPNNLKQGDLIFVEEAWEDEGGYYHDENAFITDIAEDGELTLDWLAPPEVKEFLSGSSGYYAKDFKKEV